MTIGSLSGVTVFAADAGTDENVEMADASDVDGTTITFWHSMGGVNGEAIDTLVKKFNDENKYGITVDDDATEIRNGGFGSTTAK